VWLGEENVAGGCFDSEREETTLKGPGGEGNSKTGEAGCREGAWDIVERSKPIPGNQKRWQEIGPRTQKRVIGSGTSPPQNEKDGVESRGGQRKRGV